MRRLCAGVFAVLLFLQTSGTGTAATDAHWINAGAGDWFDSSNWDTGVVPIRPTAAYIDNGGTAQVTGSADFNHMPYPIYVGYNNAGTLEQMTGTTGGTYLYLGKQAGSYGVYRIGGSANASFTYYVGGSGAGLLEQTGGVLNGSYFYVGPQGVQRQSGGTCYPFDFRMYGRYELSGTGLLDSSNVNTKPTFIPGQFVQTGGTHNALELDIDGTYEMQGGTATARRIVLGYSQTGLLSLSGGSLDVGNLSVKPDALVNVTGGTLVVSDSVEPGSKLAFAAGDWSADVRGGFGDFSNATFADLHQASFSSQLGTLTLLPTGTDPGQFASCSPGGLVHVVGSPLTIAAGQSVSGEGTISDRIIVYGTITRACQSNPTWVYINATNGVEVHAGGSFNLGAGTLTVEDQTSGMDGGSLKAAKFYVGNTGTASFIQSGGSFDDGDNITSGPTIYVGYAAGSNGDYELSGLATITAQNLYVGSSGSGRFRQRSGSVSLGFTTGATLSVGPAGVYEMEAGTLRSAIVYDSGRITQTGGTVSTTSDVMIASRDATGVYELNGGALSAGRDVLLGKYRNSLGTYRVGANGQLSGGRLLIGAEYGDGTSGVDGQGVFEAAGGSVSFGDIIVGRRLQGTNQLIVTNPSASFTTSLSLEFGASAHLSAVPGTMFHMTGATFKNNATSDVALAGLNNLTLVYDGGPSITSLMEVGGKDLGDSGGGLALNFAMQGLILGGANVGKLRLVDAFDNQGDGLAVKEALYVGRLELGPGSSLDLNGLNLYYQTAAIDPSATITANGGHLIALPIPEPSTLVLLGTGALGLLARAWRRRKRAV